MIVSCVWYSWFVFKASVTIKCCNLFLSAFRKGELQPYRSQQSHASTSKPCIVVWCKKLIERKKETANMFLNGKRPPPLLKLLQEPMVSFVMDMVRPDVKRQPERIEARVSLKILPLRMNVDQVVVTDSKISLNWQILAILRITREYKFVVDLCRRLFSGFLWRRFITSVLREKSSPLFD